MAHGAALAALAVTAYVAGAALLGRWFGGAGGVDGAPAGREGGSSVCGRLETAALALPLGLAALAQLGLVLGLLGWLRPGPVLAVVAATHALAWRGWRLLLRGGSAGGRAGGAWRVLPALAVMVVVVPLWLLSLYPPTAFDATLYHLPYAREFAATGALPFLPGLRYPIFPQLDEVLLALVMLFGDDVAAQSVTLLATLATALVLLAWARRRGAEGRAVGWIAAAAFLGCPIVAALAGTAYVEPAMVLFGVAALFAFLRWRESPRRETAWLALAGVFAGSAAAVKYLGLLFVAAVMLGAALAPPAAGRWRRLLVTAAAAGVVLAPWYLRILAATGNPLFPYFPDLFGASPWVAGEFPRAAGLAATWGRVLRELLRLPWDMVVARGRLGAQPPYSPLFLLLLPALAAAAVRDRRTRVLLLLAAAYAAAVLAPLPEARYLLPLAPLLGLAAGEGAGVWMRAARRRGGGALPVPGSWIAVFAILCLLPGWLYACYRLLRLGPVPVTAAERAEFLARELPVYPAIRYLNQACGGAYTVYALHAENMRYFAAGRFLGDWSGPAAFGDVVPPDGDPEMLSGRLRGLGADHLLIVRGKSAPLQLDAAGFRRFFQAIYADRSTQVFALGPAPVPRAPGGSDGLVPRGDESHPITVTPGDRREAPLRGVFVGSLWLAAQCEAWAGAGAAPAARSRGR